MDGQTDRQTDRQTENLILQDFVPCWGRCPATAQLQPKNCIKQGKGTADHMMPLGDWSTLLFGPLGIDNPVDCVCRVQ